MGSGRHGSWCSSAYTPFEASYHAAPILHHITSRFAWVRGPFPTVPWITFQECLQHNFLLRWSHVNDMGLRGGCMEVDGKELLFAKFPLSWRQEGWNRCSRGGGEQQVFCKWYVTSVYYSHGMWNAVIPCDSQWRKTQLRNIMNKNWTFFCVSTNSSNGFWGHFL